MKTKRQEKGYDYLIKGLTELIGGDTDKSFKSFKKSIEYNPDFEVPYIYMGKIMRDKGYWNNALSLHTQLLVRKKLHRFTKEAIYKEIVLDYVKGKDYKNALTYYKKLKDVGMSCDMLNVYIEIVKNIYDPYKAYKLLEKKKRGLGVKYLEKVKYNIKDNISDYEFVITLYKKGESLPVSAFISGEIFYYKREYNKALDAWMVCIKKDGEVIKDIFEELIESAYRSGNMAYIEDELKKIKHPNEWVDKAIYEILIRKGEYEEALNYAITPAMKAFVYLKTDNIRGAENILRNSSEI